MVNGFRIIFFPGLNKGFGLKFREGRKTHRLKCSDYNNEDSSPNTINGKNVEEE